MHPNFPKIILVYTNTSQNTINSVLQQKNENE